MMSSKSWFYLSIFYIITTQVSLTVSQQNFTAYLCSDDYGNFTKNGTYQTNLNSLLSSLSKNINPYGFYNASVGQAPNKVSATVLCRGDLDIQTCRECIDNSAKMIIQDCPIQKEAIGFYDGCMLRYSNKSSFGIMSTAPAFVLLSSVNYSNVDLLPQVLGRLVSNTIENQTYNGGSEKKFGIGRSNLNNKENIYALMQCTPDLDALNCKTCLGWASNVIFQYCYGSVGARVLGPSCSFRYELYPFYNETGIPSPPPPLPPPPQLAPAKGKHNNKTIIIIVICAIMGALGAVILIIAGIFIRRRKLQKRKEEKIEVLDAIDKVDSEQYGFARIRAATNNFSNDNLLGRGGFGAVYKGTLPDGKEIAVKRLSKDSGQGELEFRNEVLLVAKLQHKSLVRLLGFSLEKTERLLVYEFMSNGSLDRFLFNPEKRSELNWEQRYKIIESVARGLVYLHKDSRLKIIHRDLKASNILLDEQMNAKISDFGMAKLFKLDESAANTNRVVGTYGYMAPEYALHGLFSDKSDVFSYGVLVLEIITGRKNCYFQDGQNVQDLLSYAWKNWLEGKASNTIDPILKSDGSGSKQDIFRCIHIGLLCVQDNLASRPDMASVVLMLHSFSTSLPKPSEPAFFSHSSGSNSNNPPANQPEPAALTVQSLNEVSITDIDPR